MRLIDADASKKQIAGMTIANNYPANKASALCDLMDAQPTACDVDKVVAELTKRAEEFSFGVSEFQDGYYAGMKDGFRQGIQIVKGGGIDGD